MRKIKLSLFVVVVLIIAGFFSAVSVYGQDDQQGLQKQLLITVEINDGSRVVGAPSTSLITTQTSFAKLDIPWEELQFIDFRDDKETAILKFRNGDRITGTLFLKLVELKTIFGEVSIGIRQVKKISVKYAGILSMEGLVAYYPFKDNANDESGHGNNGTVYGAKLTTDRFGNANSAYSFDGKDDYISVADNVVLNPTNITISAWIKLSNTKDYKFIIQKYNPNYSNQGYAMAVNLSGAANQPAMWVGGSAWTIGTFMWDTGWHHIMGIYNDSMVKIYVDGTQIASQAQTANMSYPASLYIGTYNGTTGTYNFSGIIDDVRIYNRALSESEGKELYDIGE